MPAVFVSHGSPMVALQRGPYQDALAKFSRKTKPSAIIAISAHWASGTTINITGSERHSTIHDFGGFPAALYELTYDAPGSPALANRIARLLQAGGWETDITSDRGLDHGVWIPLRLMYPAGDIPVIGLSVPLQLPPRELFKIGEALAPLRREGILILGSGGIVHNLRLINFADPQAAVDEWAAEFDAWFRNAVVNHDIEALFDFSDKAPHAHLAVPTYEHFAPAFVTLGAGSDCKEVSTIYEGFDHGNISMRSFAIG
jgi:4,5-DOPA dioxygenase extradiol